MVAVCAARCARCNTAMMRIMRQSPVEAQRVRTRVCARNASAKDIRVRGGYAVKDRRARAHGSSGAICRVQNNAGSEAILCVIYRARANDTR